MPKFCDKCGSELKDNAKFCDKCESEVKFTSHTQNNSNVPNIPIQVEEKSMAIAMIISFFFYWTGNMLCGRCGQRTGNFPMFNTNIIFIHVR